MMYIGVLHGKKMKNMLNMLSKQTCKVTCLNMLNDTYMKLLNYEVGICLKIMTIGRNLDILQDAVISFI